MLDSRFARSDHEDGARRFASSDEHVGSSGRRVQQIAGLHAALLPFDDCQTLAIQNKERLLGVLAVVEACWLSWSDDVHVDAKLRERAVALET